ncbi:S-layer homology domain-containing protein [Paenibacillus dendritiformis]|uniref:S-layer homology domain-containing protein n=1 Tax=Paenibacillus dendritiformis TaxID=130049 RepID=UPI0020C49F69|nr:S-layer homology domain-containing protein [Paenibacillus dendritiformis]CAH8768761.1 S-layer homology domain-containing protein [Paenibacillus dendritiformis]
MKWLGKSMLAALAALTSWVWMSSGNAYAASHDVKAALANRTKQEISGKWLQYKPMGVSNEYMKQKDIYEVMPKMSVPYAPGKLKPEYIADGVNATNFARYLAGLPDDIQPDWELQTQQQAAALVNAANNMLTHYPVQPPGMEETLYKLGEKGARTSNISAGRSTFYESVIEGYMSDSGTSNIDRVGHRRWILNPAMSKTMFGIAYTSEGYPYSAMYAIDKGRTEQVKYEYISWPAAGYFPEEIFAPNDPWSLSLNMEQYDKSRTDQIEVTLIRERDGKRWVFDQRDTDKEGKYFHVDTNYYGIPFNITFRPDGIERFQDDDRFHVKINGIYDKAGQPAVIEYDTVFFDMVPEVSLRATSLLLQPGEKMKLNYRRSPGDPKMANVQFVVDDPKIASIDEEGYITGKNPGSTQLAITNYFQEDQWIEVEVREPAKGDAVSSWALPGYQQAKSNGLIPLNYDYAYQSPITRSDFAKLTVKLCENIVGTPLTQGTVPFQDTKNADIAKAYTNGLMNGTSKTKFTPSGSITRQQAATLLMNAHALLSERTGQSASALQAVKPAFADDALIAPWAKENVYKAVSLSLMSGANGQKFNPDGVLTYEQTFVLLNNLFEKFADAEA